MIFGLVTFSSFLGSITATFTSLRNVAVERAQQADARLRGLLQQGAAVLLAIWAGVQVWRHVRKVAASGGGAARGADTDDGAAAATPAKQAEAKATDGDGGDQTPVQTPPRGAKEAAITSAEDDGDKQAQVDGEASKGKQTVDINRVQNWADEDDNPEGEEDEADRLGEAEA